MDELRFIHWGPSSKKVMCPICGRTGYGSEKPTLALAAPWQKPCLRNPLHTHRCTCGHRYPSKASLAAHIRAMKMHHPHDKTHIRKDPA